jgi:phosphatidylserine decarboxylase
VQDVGRVDQGRLMTLKGIEYSLDSLLPRIDTQPYEGGQFVIIFLSPLDCHRVFSPMDGYVEEAVHVPGARLLVHPPFQRREYPVYTLNERMILRLSTALGSCVVVMIAGWGVGNITLPAAPEFRPRSNRVESHAWKSRLPVKRGDWIATFELGSTVVLIVPSSLEATALVSPNQEIHYGQPILGYGAIAHASQPSG